VEGGQGHWDLPTLRNVNPLCHFLAGRLNITKQGASERHDDIGPAITI
jgi:hypothetical protein